MCVYGIGKGIGWFKWKVWGVRWCYLGIGMC